MPTHKRVSRLIMLDQSAGGQVVCGILDSKNECSHASQPESAPLADREREALIPKDSADAPPPRALERRPPRNERELLRVLDDGKAAAGEHNAAAIRAAHLFRLS
jgi:hypothetical protein